MSTRPVLLLSLIWLSTSCLFGGTGLAIDDNCGGTIPVGGTTFLFMADSFGSGACPDNPNLTFANQSPNPWFNLLVTATTPTALSSPLTCDPGTAFMQCTVTFDPNKLLYSASFFGEDSNHVGIPISMFIDGAFTHEFGFNFSGFPANQSFTVNANVSAVPEPSTVDFMLGGFVLVLALSMRARAARSSIGQRASITSSLSRL